MRQIRRYPEEADAFLHRMRLRERSSDMFLAWAFVFFIVALVAGILGFSGIAGASSSIAQVLFLLFLVAFVATVLTGRKPPRS